MMYDDSLEFAIEEKMHIRIVVEYKNIYVLRLFTNNNSFLNYPKIYEIKLCEVEVMKVELLI